MIVVVHKVVLCVAPETIVHWLSASCHRFRRRAGGSWSPQTASWRHWWRFGHQLICVHGRSFLREVFTGQGGVVEEGGMGGGMSCQLFQSPVIYILFPFQDPQNDQYSASKRCQLATLKIEARI